MERFGIAAFRSRQQVLMFRELLQRSGIGATVISTPKDVSIGCGLSVRFAYGDMARAIAVYKRTAPSALIGFYAVEKDGLRTGVKPVKVFSLGIDDLSRY